ncbi:hypothetical protein AX14_000553 [Amanita brunnescens Koide BX004]|nr:hypothetical protein AX14_000553 [Amanita brunnescens Koide BX004]
MALSSTGPPGPPRPKNPTTPTSSLTLASSHLEVLSPVPMQPATSWFQLLSSSSPGPIPFTLPPAASANLLPVQPHAGLAPTSFGVTFPRLPMVPNSTITTLAANPCLPSSNDPWTQAHVRVCAHASESCAACSIALVCCSCRALRFTPGSPLVSSARASPALLTRRSRSASPALFRTDVGNGPPPSGFDAHADEHDDDAYVQALLESDTCDNSSCPNGPDAAARYSIIVEAFDDGAEEFYNRTYRACASCNRSCKKSFLGNRIKSRIFDNSVKDRSKVVTLLACAPDSASRAPVPALPKNTVFTCPPRHNNAVPGSASYALQHPLNVAPSPVLSEAMVSAEATPLHHGFEATLATLHPDHASVLTLASSALPTLRPSTPLEVFAVVSYAHRTACDHIFDKCPVCSRGILCCSCNKLHTAPARLRLQCAACSHFACATCTSPFCCSCRKPWFPGDAPNVVLASRFRSGARSTKSSKKGSASSSSSSTSGPGSLATAHSDRQSPDPFTTTGEGVPLPQVTQSSTDEIDAFADSTIKLAIPSQGMLAARATAPSPSSNLPLVPTAPSPVFSRPNPTAPVASTTDDVPTATPSRAPSRAASVTSTGDAGIAEPLQPDAFAQPAEPPAFSDVIGRIHRCHPLASLKVDDDDPRHFLARDNTRVEDIANETEYLLTSTTSWPSILYFLRDIMHFDSIRGSTAEFQVVLAGLADIWSDAADIDAREILRNMIEAVRLMPKAEKEIDRLEATATRYRNERQTTRAQLKTTEAELSHLRQAANETLDSNARLLSEIDQLRATDAVAIAQERDEAQAALKDAITHSKSAMAKQVSRYQHLFSLAEERQSRLKELEKEAEEKDAYILKTEAEHAEIYRERESAERMITTLRQQLHDATLLFEETREARRIDQKDFDEQVISYKARISELNGRLSLLPSGEAELRSLVGMANERAGIAEEEYRKKSAELKEALKEVNSLKAQLAKPVAAKSDKPKGQSQSQSAKKVRWGFEPEGDSSQPFWDHSNEYSRYIANMVAATVTALPNIPMHTAISSAIDTVRAAGPTIFSQPSLKPSSDAKRPPTGRSSPSPGPSTSPAPTGPKASSSSTAQQRRSRAPSPSAPSPPSANPDPKPIGTMTFAQMAASVLDPPAAASMHPAKAKPTWRAIEHRFFDSNHHHLSYSCAPFPFPPLFLAISFSLCTSSLLSCSLSLSSEHGSQYWAPSRPSEA